MAVVGPARAGPDIEDLFYFYDGHLAVLVLGVHKEEVEAVDCVAVGLSVEDGDDPALPAVEVAKGGLHRGEGTPDW